jgi:protein phosphatase-4 regulatory subunit 3
LYFLYSSPFLTFLNTDSDEEDSASASNTQKEKPASNIQKEQPKPHLSNGVAASPTSSRYSSL